MGYLRRFFLLFLGMVFLVGMPVQPAYAAFKLLECDSGTVKADTKLYDDQIPEAWKSDEVMGDCQGDSCDHVAMRHIFSNVLYDFMGVLNNVIGKVYCGIQYSLTEALRVLLSIYVAVFGFQMLMGTAQLNTRDVMMRLIKIVLVWTFATNSTAAVNIVFRGAASFINDASLWILGSIEALQDIEVGNAGCKIMDVAGKGSTTPIFGFFDCVIYYAFTGKQGEAAIRLMVFLGAMLVAFPPTAFMAYYWALKTFLIMARAVINLLLALGSIAFLVALMPIFISLALFQFTSHMFENWVRYMISYIIQVVMIFVVLVMWILVFFQFTYFFDDLSRVIFWYTTSAQQSGTQQPVDSVGVCPTYFAKQYSPFNTAKHCGGGRMDDPNATAEQNEVTDVYRTGPIVCCRKKDFNPKTNPEDLKALLPVTALIRDTEFLYYVFYHLIGLIVITYCFGGLLEQVPSIASSISAPAPLPTVLSGFGMKNFGSAGGMGQGMDNLRNTFIANRASNPQPPGKPR